MMRLWPVCIHIPCLVMMWLWSVCIHIPCLVIMWRWPVCIHIPCLVIMWLWPVYIHIPCLVMMRLCLYPYPLFGDDVAMMFVSTSLVWWWCGYDVFVFTSLVWWWCGYDLFVFTSLVWWWCGHDLFVFTKEMAMNTVRKPQSWLASLKAAAHGLVRFSWSQRQQQEQPLTSYSYTPQPPSGVMRCWAVSKSQSINKSINQSSK